MERLRRLLRGDPPKLPIGEALHPVTLAAVALLAVNDWLIKPRVAIGSTGHAIAGKLSDLAGLVAAPVILTALVGLGLQLLGAHHPAITRRRLVASVAATGAVFAAVKLSPAAARLFVDAVSWFGRRAAVVVDPTDLLCLPALAVAYWIGRDELLRCAASPTAALARRP